MKIAIIANGEFYNFEPELQEYNFIIAADGGANYCQRLKIKPHLIMGDFDSITEETKKYFSLIPQTKKHCQDTTDLEKIFLYIARNFKLSEIEKIGIFCGTSNSRLDHLMANVFLMARFSQWPMEIISRFSIIKILEKDYILENMVNKTVSIFPMGTAIGLELIGFNWPMGKKQFSISNIVIAGHAMIKIKTGKIILIINK